MRTVSSGKRRRASSTIPGARSKPVTSAPASARWAVTCPGPAADVGHRTAAGQVGQALEEPAVERLAVELVEQLVGVGGGDGVVGRRHPLVARVGAVGQRRLGRTVALAAGAGRARPPGRGGGSSAAPSGRVAAPAPGRAARHGRRASASARVDLVEARRTGGGDRTGVRSSPGVCGPRRRSRVRRRARRSSIVSTSSSTWRYFGCRAPWLGCTHAGEAGGAGGGRGPPAPRARRGRAPGRGPRSGCRPCAGR